MSQEISCNSFTCSPGGLLKRAAIATCCHLKEHSLHLLSRKMAAIKQDDGADAWSQCLRRVQGKRKQQPPPQQ